MNYPDLMCAEFFISILIAGFWGLSLGSFLNVVIYRLPRKESIVFPGSHCPECGSPIKYLDNIPIVSFILLRGQCRVCSAPRNDLCFEWEQYLYYLPVKEFSGVFGDNLAGILGLKGETS